MGVKISYYYFDEKKETDLVEAVKLLLTPMPYSTTGRLEFVQEQADQNSEMIGKLISKLVQEEVLDAKDLNDLFGYRVEGPIKIVEVK